MTNDIKICIDLIDNDSIQGWFINTPSPEDNQMSLYMDGQYKAITQANLNRYDVEALHGQLRCGFCFDIERFPSYQHLKLKSADKTVIFSHRNAIEVLEPTSELINPYSLQRHHQLQKIKIDLSKPINGTNWYDIEARGRWAGPELESTLTIPALTAGRYHLQLKIDNHFCDLKTLQVRLNDQLVHFENTEFPVPVVLQAEVAVEKELDYWTLDFKCTKIGSPENNEMEQRQLAFFLETVILNKLTSS